LSTNPIRQLLQGRSLEGQRSAIMGIINTTPDSFSDGGQFLSADSAVQQGLKLVTDGADILDIGGESTRPGAEPVSLQEELDRVIPVIEALVAQTATPISIDTYKPDVMLAAIAAGASMINDVNALRADGALEVAKQAQVPVCLMHMLGEPKNMQKQPSYNNVVAEVIEFLNQQIERCESSGIAKQDLIVDPGIGFGKTVAHNLSLLNAVSEFNNKTGCAVLIGVSRKSMINNVLDREVEDRLPVSVGLAVQARLNGANILRVHDVRATYDAVRVAEAVINSNNMK